MSPQGRPTKVPSGPFAAFASLVRERRTELGMTRRALADRLAVSVSTIASYEGARGLPREARVRELALLLKLEPDALLREWRAARTAQPARSMPEQPSRAVSVIYVDFVLWASNWFGSGSEAVELLSEYRDLVRGPLEAAGETWIAGVGDGVVAAFEDLAAALECSIQIQRRVEQRNQIRSPEFAVRIGVSHGELTTQGGVYFGAALVEAHEASRLADNGEILATERVQVLVDDDTGLRLTPVEPRPAADLLEPIRVFAVRSAHRETSAPAPRVFVCYSSDDVSLARRVAAGLSEFGISAWLDEWMLRPGDSLEHSIAEQLSSRDFLVLLVSARSLSSASMFELLAGIADSLRARAVHVIPVLVADSSVPEELHHLMSLDLRGDFEAGVQRLAEWLQVASSIEFSALTPLVLEELVADLLRIRDFVVDTPTRLESESGVDLVASRVVQDPFGVPYEEKWLVMVKLYGKGRRVGLKTLRELIGFLSRTPVPDRLLVVTTGQLTSVATEYLSAVASEPSGIVRVVDGPELHRLLVAHPQLIRQYFDEMLGAIPQ